MISVGAFVVSAMPEPLYEYLGLISYQQTTNAEGDLPCGLEYFAAIADFLRPPMGGFSAFVYL
jgi:hypothetical protein